MTQKEKLIKILYSSPVYLSKSEAEALADWLVANSVVVLPCKVGDMVFCIRKNPYAKGLYVKENTAYRVSFCVDGYISIFSTKEDVLGKTVFLTREEAEAALKKMEGEK